MYGCKYSYHYVINKKLKKQEPVHFEIKSITRTKESFRRVRKDKSKEAEQEFKQRQKEFQQYKYSDQVQLRDLIVILEKRGALFVICHRTLVFFNICFSECDF